MKAHYFLLTQFLLLLVLLKANAQENLIVGGNMEKADESSWNTSSLVNDPTSITEYTFGYTKDAPSSGKNGCLYFSATNIATNGSHIMFYQQVTLKKGKTYQFDMAVKSLQPMNNSWFEIYLGNTEPVDGADYGAGMIPLGGFKWSGWDAGCTDMDMFDGTLRKDGCMANSQDDILIPGEGDTIMYIGFKAGIWATATTVEFVVDNISLTEASSVSSIVSSSVDQVTLFPNPVENKLQIVSGKDFIQGRIINVAGKEVLKVNGFSNSFDVSTLKSGIYLIELRDSNDNTYLKRFSKQ